MSDMGSLGGIMGGIVICCCFWIVIFFIAGGASPDNSESYTDIDVNDIVSENMSSYNTSGASLGEWNVVNGVLTNGTDTGKLEWGYDRDSRKSIHVVPTDFVFVYKDKNSSEYEGDANLYYSTFNDTLTGCTYHVDRDLTRGIAYKTNSKFDLKDGFNITRWRDLYDTYYTIYDNKIILNNGSIIQGLSVADDLTPEEKMYFNDYDTQLYKYYEDKKLQKMDDIESWNARMDAELDVQNRIALNKKEKSGSFSGYSSRSGYIYGRYS